MWIWLSMIGELVVAGAFSLLGLWLASRKPPRQALVMGALLVAVCFGIAVLASLWFLAKERAG